MDGRMFDSMWEGMVLALGLILVAAFALGALAMWLLPKLWHWLMPIIHAATA